MLGNITIGQYIPGESVLHRMDPRVKIVLVILNMIVIFNLKTYTGLVMMYVFILGLIALSKISLRYTLKGLKPILYLLIFTAILNFATIKSDNVLFSFWIFKISTEAIDITAKLSLRLILFVISTSLLTLTTTPILLTDGLESLMKPLSYVGIPAHDIAMMMTIALRFIPTLLEETDRIIKAQAARGADFDTGGLISKAKSFVPIIIPLILGAFRRAFELAEAMEARCYRGSKGRTRFRILKIKRMDLAAIMFFILFSALILMAQHYIMV